MAFVQANGDAALLFDGHRVYLRCEEEIAVQTEVEVCGQSVGRKALVLIGLV